MVAALIGSKDRKSLVLCQNQTWLRTTHLKVRGPATWNIFLPSDWDQSNSDSLHLLFLWCGAAALDNTALVFALHLLFVSLPRRAPTPALIFFFPPPVYLLFSNTVEFSLCVGNGHSNSSFKENKVVTKQRYNKQNGWDSNSTQMRAEVNSVNEQKRWNNALHNFVQITAELLFQHTR